PAVAIQHVVPAAREFLAVADSRPKELHDEDEVGIVLPVSPSRVAVRVVRHRACNPPLRVDEEKPVYASPDGGAFFPGERVECGTSGGAPFGRCDPPLLWTTVRHRSLLPLGRRSRATSAAFVTATKTSSA